VSASGPVRRASAACAAMALLAAGCASHAGSPPPARSAASGTEQGVVAWVHAPTAPPVPSTPAPPAPRPTDARACRADDIAARFQSRNGAGGHEIFYVRFPNVSESTCVLFGYPQVTATEPGQPEVGATDGSFFQLGDPANMAPGGNTLLGLETDTNCAARPGGGGGGPLYHHFDIALPAGGTVGLDQPDGLDLTCGLHLTRFWVPRAEHPEPPDSLTELTASLEMPATVAADAVLVYVVALTNPTEHPITLDPCPAYIQADSSPTPVKDIEALNCAPVRTLAAGATTRFEMHLQMPGDTAAGTVRVFWSLVGPDMRSWASASIEVVSASAATHT
jgi:hypothetical protein